MLSHIAAERTELHERSCIFLLESLNNGRSSNLTRAENHQCKVQAQSWETSAFNWTIT